MKKRAQLMRWAVAAAVATTLTGLITACGTSQATDNAVVIAKPVDTIAFTALDLAESQGFFKNAGVNAKIVLVTGSSVANAALRSGSVQFSGVAALPFLLARQQHIPLTSVAEINHGSSLQLIAKRTPATAAAGNQSLTQRLRLLNGVKIGYVSASDGGFIDLLLRDAGLDPHSVKKVSFDSASAAVAALGTGEIGAAIGSPPNTIQPVTDGRAVVIANVGGLDQYRSMTNDILATTSDFATSHAKTVAAVARALKEADDFILDPRNRAKVLAFEHKHFPSYSGDVLAKSLDLTTFSAGAQQSQAKWDAATRAYTSGGALKQGSAPEGDVWTNTYLK